MKKTILYLATMAMLTPMSACNDDDEPNVRREYADEETPSRTAPDFAFGADPSWVTAMEDANWKFRDAAGNEGDCLTILRGIGFNACRLRVWVNPTDGYCNTADLVRKAVRAYNMGYHIMVDFHYSDRWADPGAQYKPSVWDGCETLDAMADKLYQYTKKVLTAVRTNGVDVAWVQIGNETRGGMIQYNSDGSASDVNGKMGTDYVKLHAAGCKAAKEVYPRCKTVVHFEGGNETSKTVWALDKMKAAGAEYDIFGVSLYPDMNADGWYEDYISTTIDNLNMVHETYGCDVMVCEVGCDVSHTSAKMMLNDVVVRCQKEVPSCKGVFYWEPECYNPGDGAWNGYDKGGFLSDGRPSEALLNAFSGKANSVMGM